MFFYLLLLTYIYVFLTDPTLFKLYDLNFTFTISKTTNGSDKRSDVN